MAKITKIADISEPDKRFCVEVKVLEADTQPMDIMRQRGTVKDSSGACEFILWETSAQKGAPMLDMGKTYQLDGVYSKVYREQMQITINAKTKVTEIGEKPSGQATLGNL